MLSELLFPPTGYHWLILGLLLLILETLGAAGFLLGPAIAAMALGIILLLVDFHWHWQLGIFAVLAVACTVVYWKRFRRFNEAQADHELLNNRAAQLIGRRFVADQDLPSGGGKLRIGDTLWSVVAEEGAIHAAQTVEVIAAEGMTLRVRKIEAGATPAPDG